MSVKPLPSTQWACNLPEKENVMIRVTESCAGDKRGLVNMNTNIESVPEIQYSLIHIVIKEHS